MKHSLMLFIASFIFSLIAIISFFFIGNRLFSTIWLCMGTLCLSFGYAQKKREGGNRQ